MKVYDILCFSQMISLFLKFTDMIAVWKQEPIPSITNRPSQPYATINSKHFHVAKDHGILWCHVWEDDDV